MLITPSLTLPPQGGGKNQGAHGAKNQGSHDGRGNENSFPPGGGRLGWGGDASPFFIIEADEYDTAFFDKRSKFLHYPPRTAVLNNLEFDHADIFPDLAAIETQFHHWVRTIPGNALIVANGADAALARVLARGCWTPIERFLAVDGWQVGAQDHGGFEVLLKGVPQGTVKWRLTGTHNQANALAAIAAARHCGVPAAAAIAALSRFANVKRRMEVRGVVRAVTVYDDFAHHPTAIQTTIEGLRGKIGAGRPPTDGLGSRAGQAGALPASGVASMPEGTEPAPPAGGRILAVLEPRSNTMKLGAMKDRLAASLAAADLAFCYTNGLGWDAAAALAPLGSRAVTCGDIDQLAARVAAAARPGDHVVVMSNGAFGGIHEKLLAKLARSF
ncbi:MAG: UDP-N-acetylmuramate:L-alanyl-gamma-D-glutamyl-meso-diaminopimelate ligase [Betaproteobacteria bacterium]|nr:UDP-N-acetylmuramate:L-alanyl-gamma-D-glutamyl-meso-diaminopimelate ligase [Betaproteobacteria bacterium]